MYSWGVVPTWKVCDWVHPALQEPIPDEEMVVLPASPCRKEVVGPESPGRDRGSGRTGLLTPALLIDSSTHRARGRKTSSLPSRESRFNLGRFDIHFPGDERENPKPKMTRREKEKKRDEETNEKKGRKKEWESTRNAVHEKKDEKRARGECEAQVSDKARMSASGQQASGGGMPAPPGPREVSVTAPVKNQKQRGAVRCGDIHSTADKTRIEGSTEKKRKKEAEMLGDRSTRNALERGRCLHDAEYADRHGSAKVDLPRCACGGWCPQGEMSSDGAWRQLRMVLVRVEAKKAAWAKGNRPRSHAAGGAGRLFSVRERGSAPEMLIRREEVTGDGEGVLQLQRMREMVVARRAPGAGIEW
ncbi:hypothetical protein K438DRAFT_1762421 [Mycena galopus ATCC 62051]|nr:hypothetical protein K438DRAFT_1762421 [Mycena galopus ATCC 62051]